MKEFVIRKPNGNQGVGPLSQSGAIYVPVLDVFLTTFEQLSEEVIDTSTALGTIFLDGGSIDVNDPAFRAFLEEQITDDD